MCAVDECFVAITYRSRRFLLTWISTGVSHILNCGCFRCRLVHWSSTGQSSSPRDGDWHLCNMHKSIQWTTHALAGTYVDFVDRGYTCFRCYFIFVIFFLSSGFSLIEGNFIEVSYLSHKIPRMASWHTGSLRIFMGSVLNLGLSYRAGILNDSSQPWVELQVVIVVGS